MLDAGLPEAGGDTEHPVHALADLRGAEPQGRSFSKEGGDDGEDVDHLAEPAVHQFAEDRPQHRRDQAGVVPAVGGVGDGEAEDAEHGPGVWAPGRAAGEGGPARGQKDSPHTSNPQRDCWSNI